MAPTQAQVVDQTLQIIKCLFDDDDNSTFRMYDQGPSLDADGIEVDTIEPDGPDDFDPVLIADKLKQVADAMDADAKFQEALSQLKKTAAQEAVEAALGDCVDSMCKSPVCQRAEVAPEMQLIRATVAFGLYVKKSSPELKMKVQNAMGSFLNKRVGSWVTQQGGWDKVAP